MQSRFRLQRLAKEPEHSAKWSAAAPEIANEPGRCPSTKPVRDRAGSSGGVAIDIHGVAEILNQHQILGFEHCGVRRVVVKIRDHKMLLCSSLDDGRRERVLREIEL